MAKIKRGTTVKVKHKKILKLSKGYQGRNKNVYRVAREKVEKALQYQYRDRRTKKRDFRRLWIVRINAAVRAHGLTYGTFMDALKKAGIMLDRKVLANMAAVQPDQFGSLVTQVQDGVKPAAKTTKPKKETAPKRTAVSKKPKAEATAE